MRHFTRHNVYLHLYCDSLEVIEGLIGTDYSISETYFSPNFRVMSKLSEKNSTMDHQIYLTDSFCEMLDEVLTKYIFPEEFVYDRETRLSFDIYRVYYNKNTLRQDLMLLDLKQVNRQEVSVLREELVDLIQEYNGTLELFLLDTDLYTMFMGVNIQFRDRMVEVFEDFKEFNFEHAQKTLAKLLKDKKILKNELPCTKRKLNQFAKQIENNDDFTMIL